MAAAKLLVPETEPQMAGDAQIVKSTASNFLEAITNGTRDGLSLAANVGVTLLVFTAFVYMVNDLLGWVGGWTGANAAIAANTSFDTLSMELILGYIGAPIAWLVGVASEDILVVGQLLGEKTVINEFYAYETLGQLKAGMSERSDPHCHLHPVVSPTSPPSASRSAALGSSPPPAAENWPNSDSEPCSREPSPVC